MKIAKHRRKMRITVQVDDDEARRRLVAHLLEVMQDSKASYARRDQAAWRLTKLVVAADKARLAQQAKRRTRTPPKRHYFSQKREDEAESRTAHRGTSWDGLINGSSKAKPKRSVS